MDILFFLLEKYQTNWQNKQDADITQILKEKTQENKDEK